MSKCDNENMNFKINKNGSFILQIIIINCTSFGHRNYNIIIHSWKFLFLERILMQRGLTGVIKWRGKNSQKRSNTKWTSFSKL